jgi:DnaK suppressor protein
MPRIALIRGSFSSERIVPKSPALKAAPKASSSTAGKPGVKTKPKTSPRGKVTALVDTSKAKTVAPGVDPDHQATVTDIDPHQDLEGWAKAVLGDMRAKALRGLLNLKEEQDQHTQAGESAGDEADITAQRDGVQTRMRAVAVLQDRLREIEAALERLKTGDYGWCEETGEPIPVARLHANPVARTTVEAQERRERLQRTHLRAA